MNWDAELQRGIEQLIARIDGPMHLRILLQPTIAAVLAIRSGWKDAREGNPPYLMGLLTASGERLKILRSGWKDASTSFALAFAIDAAYQIINLKAFYPLQSLAVALTLCLIPYTILRGPVARLCGRFRSPGSPY